MRWIAFGSIIAFSLSAQAQEAPKLQYRYGFSYNDAYGQKTPQEALKSIVKAFDNNRYDYFVAQLVDPAFVDSKVKEHKKAFPTVKEENKTPLAFDKLLQEIRGHFREDPVLEREIRFFARDGMFEETGDSAIGTWKGSARKIYLKKVDDRWFMENRLK